MGSHFGPIKSCNAATIHRASRPEESIPAQPIFFPSSFRKPVTKFIAFTKLLTAICLTHQNTGPVWSPDGSKIAFMHFHIVVTGTQEASRSEIGVMNSDG